MIFKRTISLAVLFLLSIMGVCSAYGQTHSDLVSAQLLSLSPLLIDLSKIDLQKPSDFQTDYRERAQGPGTGCGGSSCALMIRENTKTLVAQRSEEHTSELQSH